MVAYVVSMSLNAYSEILGTVGCLPAETGGLLLWPADSEHVSDFWFDRNASCTGATYSPDATTMNAMLRDVWRPQGLDWKGFVHSHPRGFDHLSPGDMSYIARLLLGSPDMSSFIAPIVLPELFSFRTFVVLKDNPGIAIPARLHIN